MLSKTAVHAVKAVIVLAELPEKGFQGTASLAKRIGAPQNYLGKLLQILARAGVVQSQRGLGGGFQLAKPPEEIRIFDIVDPIDHLSRWTGCLMGGALCAQDAPCGMHEGWAKAREAYLGMLESSTVADVLSRNRPVPDRA